MSLSFFMSLPRASRLIIHILFLSLFGIVLFDYEKKSYKEIIFYKDKDIFVFFNVIYRMCPGKEYVPITDLYLSEV